MYGRRKAEERSWLTLSSAGNVADGPLSQDSAVHWMTTVAVESGCQANGVRKLGLMRDVRL